MALISEVGRAKHNEVLPKNLYCQDFNPSLQYKRRQSYYYMCIWNQNVLLSVKYPLKALSVRFTYCSFNSIYFDKSPDCQKTKPPFCIQTVLYRSTKMFPNEYTETNTQAGLQRSMCIYGEYTTKISSIKPLKKPFSFEKKHKNTELDKKKENCS